ncbi:hypothetical protein [Paenarthrobacter sp. FR1]|uniref:hypothetical protein n=1 Tax=Paenarthrobacter sp. FR1 TaxID=3439548 RepID=UPI003DA5E3E0
MTPAISTSEWAGFVGAPGSSEWAGFVGVGRVRRCYPAILHGSRDLDVGVP